MYCTSVSSIVKSVLMSLRQVNLATLTCIFYFVSFYSACLLYERVHNSVQKAFSFRLLCLPHPPPGTLPQDLAAAPPRDIPRSRHNLPPLLNHGSVPDL